MVRYTKTHTKARVQISTNAALLNEKRARELMEAGLDRINIDIDGFTKETYEGIRRRLSFNQVMANTKRLLDLRGEMGRRLFVRLAPRLGPGCRQPGPGAKPIRARVTRARAPGPRCCG